MNTFKALIITYITHKQVAKYFREFNKSKN